MKLNLGCGTQIIDDWLNVDYALGARLTKIPFFKLLNKQLKLFNIDWDNRVYIHNLTKKFPFKNESIDIIYCSHTLEHFTRETGLRFLQECHRVLKVGGIVRIVVPDLQCIVTNFNNKVFPADQFLEKLSVLNWEYKSKLKNFLAPYIQYPHKCMYDTPTLLSIIGNVGFNAQSKDPFNSKIEDIKKIEKEERTKFSVIIEGHKN
jgi:predicted SAM-dependent methyltransferase